MSKHPLLLGLTLLSASLFTGQAFADRTVTDQLGRQVTLPDHITRVVVLQHQTLNLLVQLHAAEDIVGVLSSWQKQLGPQFARFMPEIGQLATPGDLTQANIESLLAKSRPITPGWWRGSALSARSSSTSPRPRR